MEHGGLRRIRNRNPIAEPTKSKQIFPKRRTKQFRRFLRLREQQKPAKKPRKKSKRQCSQEKNFSGGNRLSQSVSENERGELEGRVALRQQKRQSRDLRATISQKKRSDFCSNIQGLPPNKRLPNNRAHNQKKYPIGYKKSGEVLQIKTSPKSDSIAQSPSRELEGREPLERAKARFEIHSQNCTAILL